MLSPWLISAITAWNKISQWFHIECDTYFGLQGESEAVVGFQLSTLVGLGQKRHKICTKLKRGLPLC